MAVRDLWGMIRRNALLSFGLPVLVVAATTAFVLLVTPVYEAWTSIRVDEKRTPIPLMEALESLAPGGSAINTELEVLRSRTLAEEVIDSLDLAFEVDAPRRVPRSELLTAVEVAPSAPGTEFALERVGPDRYRAEMTFRAPGQPFWSETTEPLGEAAVGETIEARGVRFTLAPGAAAHDELRFEVLPRHLAIRAFQRQLSVSRPSREADILVARYEHTDPELVRDVPNVLAGRFIARRQGVQKSEARSTVHFLGAQLDSVTARLIATEDAIREFRDRENVVDLEAEGSAYIRRLAELQGARDLIEAERASLARLLRELESTAHSPGEGPSPYRRLLAFPSLLKNPATSELLQTLTELDSQLAFALERHTRQDPGVRVIGERIDAIETQLHTTAMTYLASLTSQSASMQATLAQSRDQLGMIPDKQIEMAKYTRQAGVLGEIYKLLQVRLKEAEIAAAIEDMSVRVVDPAILPVKPFKPKEVVSIGLALLLGLMLGVGSAVLREHLDTRLHTREDLQAYQLSVLGLIPRIEGGAAPGGPRWRFGSRVAVNGEAARPRLVTRLDPHDPVFEAYRSLRTNITFATTDGVPRTLVFTSSMPGDGKSTTATNLAVTLAQQGQRVLLVDADLRRGGLHTLFESPREPGLSDVLHGRAAFEDAVQRVDAGHGATLELLATGTLPPNPAEILGSTRMGELLDRLSDRYDVVLLDAPPLNLVTDAAVLGTKADGVLLVARAGITDRGALDYALEQLANVRADVLGTVLNDVDHRRQSHYGSNGAYAYYAAARSS